MLRSGTAACFSQRMQCTTVPVNAPPQRPLVIVHVNGQPLRCEACRPLLNALLNAGCVVPTACGGVGVCRLCRVHVAKPQDGGPVTEIEVRALGQRLLDEGVRLSCQVMVQAPLTVTLLPPQGASPP